jgi:glycosyltransferase involved in cell wall biosynthesis
MDELAERSWAVRHNLESAAPGRAAVVAGAAMKHGVEAAGGYGGDFATVLASLREANRADVILSTVDTVGIPLMLLARAHAVRTPFVYVAIGLPERLARLRSRRVEMAYAKALSRASAVVAYSEHEAESLQRWLRERSAEVPVAFIPFGVDVDAFRPGDEAPDLDVVSVGADPHRDFELLLAVARSLPEARFVVVTTAEHARSLAERPPNLSVETDLPFDEMRDRLGRARVVALPVRDNSYSGATTVLLQAMALAKPVVVTRTAAIATGYGLEDGDNVQLVAPGDEAAFRSALTRVLGDDERARALGLHARATVESGLTWERYVARLAVVLADAAFRKHE